MKRMKTAELYAFLEEKYSQYNTHEFIDTDPICIPHRFVEKEDIEISGLFAALMSWGKRVTIINKCNDLLDRMDNEPYDFIKNASDHDLKSLIGFKHRTFNDTDLLYFVEFLRSVYTQKPSLENYLFDDTKNVKEALIQFKQSFIAGENYPKRTGKHLASPMSKSACKRLNMYFRWMTRKKGVDLGIWKSLPTSALYMPLDVHVVRVATKLKLLNRDKTDWVACEALTRRLRRYDKNDPVKYDFALFGMGVFEKF